MRAMRDEVARVSAAAQVQSAVVVSSHQSAALGLFTCPTCASSFASWNQCIVHRIAAHGERHQARLHIGSSVCPWCLVMFATRARCIEHVSRSRSLCWYNIIARYPALEAAEVAALDQADAIRGKGTRALGRKPSFGIELAMQTEGPQWPMLIPPGPVPRVRNPILRRDIVNAVQGTIDLCPSFGAS